MVAYFHIPSGAEGKTAGAHSRDTGRRGAVLPEAGLPAVQLIFRQEGRVVQVHGPPLPSIRPGAQRHSRGKIRRLAWPQDWRWTFPTRPAAFQEVAVLDPAGHQAGDTVRGQQRGAGELQAALRDLQHHGPSVPARRRAEPCIAAGKMGEDPGQSQGAHQQAPRHLLAGCSSVQRR